MIRTDLSIDTSEKLSSYSTLLNLSKPFCDNSSFVDSNTTISVRLPLEDPFNLNGLPIIGLVNQSPHFVFIHGSPLRFHGFESILRNLGSPSLPHSSQVRHGLVT